MKKRGEIMNNFGPKKGKIRLYDKNDKIRLCGGPCRVIPVPKLGYTAPSCPYFIRLSFISIPVHR